MPTTKTIGTASRQYSTIGAFVTAGNAASWSGGWIGDLYPDSATGEFFETSIYLNAPSSTDFVKLRAATGMSLFDTNTNPLKYAPAQNSAVAISNQGNAYTTLVNLAGNASLERLLMSAGVNQRNHTIISDEFSSNKQVDRCLSFGTDDHSQAISQFGSDTQVTNSIFIVGVNYAIQFYYASSTTKLTNCTIISPSDYSTTTGAFAFSGNYAVQFKNVAVFGFPSMYGVTTPTNCTGSNNATDLSSWPAMGSSTGIGGLTYANQFTGTTITTQNYTLKTGNSIGAGTGATDTTDIPGAIDIFGTARGTSWSIGAHQPGSSGISGTAAITLDNATLSAAGKLAIAGVASITLANLGASALGQLLIQGALNKTFANATVSATGALAVQGTLAKTLDNLTVVSAGALAIKGAASITLGNLTSAATGVLAIAGTAAITLGALSLSSNGLLAIKGLANIQLADVVCVGTGSNAGGFGSLNGQFADAALTAIGKLSIAGSAAITLGNLALSATGSLINNGVLAVTLGNATIAATGALAVKGAAAIVLQDMSVAAVSKLSIAGTSAITLGDATLIATGTSSIRGAASILLGDATLAATGAIKITGGLFATLQGLILSAIGSFVLAVNFGTTPRFKFTPLNRDRKPTIKPRPRNN